MPQADQLDNINATTAFLPCRLKDDEEPPFIGIPPYPNGADRDIAIGAELRLKAYKSAWEKCLGRVQEIIKALHAPVVNDVIETVKSAYADVLPGLPYPELPVITVSCPPNSHSLFQNIKSQLTEETEPPSISAASVQATNGGRKLRTRPDASASSAPTGASTPKDTYIVTSLHSHNCGTTMSAMKTMIGGFIAKSPPSMAELKRKPTAALSLYDINLLEVWYKAMPSGMAPKLVVLVQDFEHFETQVMQDLFHICSQSLSRIPFIFILSLSSPVTPSYLHSAYPRATLAQLRITPFHAKSGRSVVENVILQTFFDPEAVGSHDSGFRPLVMIGPTVLEAIHDTFTRYNRSLENIINILQLAHMKHFSEPLSLFVDVAPEDVETVKKEVKSHQNVYFHLALLGHAFMPADQTERDALLDDSQPDDDKAIDYLFDLLKRDRAVMQERMQKWREGFNQYATLRAQMEDYGHAAKRMKRVGVLGQMAAFMRGDLKELDVKNLVAMAQRAPPAEQRAMTKLGLPSPEKLVFLEPDFPWPDQKPQAPNHFPELWYMGETLVTLGVFNPNIHGSVVSALSYPYEYLGCDCCRPVAKSLESDDDENSDDLGREKGLWTFPDTSILFHRYLECPRMINVYDWYLSFAHALEGEFERRFQSQSGSSSPMKKRRKAVVGAEDKEAWDREVHARFLQALHELDFLGLLNHTKRRADHVQKTIFDVPHWDEE